MPRINVKDKRRQQLIEANMASIAKRGYAQTTITHVSQGAQMSRGIINFYFTTKEKMMLDTLKFLSEEYAALVEESLSLGQTAEEKLRALASLHGSKTLCNSRRLAVWAAFWGHASTHVDYRRIITKHDIVMVEKIASLWAEAASENKSTFSATQGARQFYAYLRGLWLSFLLDGEQASRQHITQAANAYLDKILPAGQSKTASKTPTSQVSKPIKKKKPVVPEGQLDFGDLFALKK